MAAYRFFPVLILLAMACPATLVDAATITSMKVNGSQNAIFFVGPIVQGDSAKFRAEAQKYGEAVVFLESNGGSTTAAIEIGEDIRLKGFATAVINGSECDSACALIWLAGSPRGLAKSGRIGFHATYLDVSGRSQESGVGNAIVGRYLTLLNLPEKAVIFATSAAPDQLNYLTTDNSDQAGMDLRVLNDINFDTKSPPAIVTKARSDTEKWASVGDWTVYVDHTLDEGCFLYADFERGTTFRVGVNGTATASYYLMVTNSDWKSVREGQKYDLTLTFGRNSPWTVSMKAIKLNEILPLYVSFSDERFWTEFANSETILLSRGATTVANLKITGSKVALEKLAVCQSEQNEKKKSRDPFAN